MRSVTTLERSRAALRRNSPSTAATCARECVSTSSAAQNRTGRGSPGPAPCGVPLNGGLVNNPHPFDRPTHPRGHQSSAGDGAQPSQTPPLVQDERRRVRPPLREPRLAREHRERLFRRIPARRLVPVDLCAEACPGRWYGRPLDAVASNGRGASGDARIRLGSVVDGAALRSVRKT